jgi:hypothetical protein
MTTTTTTSTVQLFVKATNREIERIREALIEVLTITDEAAFAGLNAEEERELEDAKSAALVAIRRADAEWILGCALQATLTPDRADYVSDLESVIDDELRRFAGWSDRKIEKACITVHIDGAQLAQILNE